MEDLRMSGDERRDERAEVTCVTTTGPGEKVVSSSVGAGGAVREAVTATERERRERRRGAVRE